MSFPSGKTEKRSQQDLGQVMGVTDSKLLRWYLRRWGAKEFFGLPRADLLWDASRRFCAVCLIGTH